MALPARLMNSLGLELCARRLVAVGGILLLAFGVLVQTAFSQEKSTVGSESGLSGGDRVSLNLRDASLRDVLNLLARQGGFNLLLGDSVDGRMTLDVRDVPLEHLLNDIARVSRLTITRDATAGRKTVLITRQASRAVSQDVSGEVSREISGEGRQPPPAAEEAPQVMIDVLFLEAPVESLEEFQKSPGRIRTGILSPEAIGTVGWTPAGTPGSTSGDHILAHPSVITLDGQQATVRLTDEVATVTRNGVVKETVGMTLEMTPKVLGDGSILLSLKPTLSQPTGPYRINHGRDRAASYYLVQTRSVDIQAVRLRPGETLVIGGLALPPDFTPTGRSERPSGQTMGRVPARTATAKTPAGANELILLINVRVLENSRPSYGRYRGDRLPEPGPETYMMTALTETARGPLDLEAAPDQLK